MLFQLQLCFLIIIIETGLLSVTIACLVADREEKRTKEKYENSL